jgi:hypothetical protein
VAADRELVGIHLPGVADADGVVLAQIALRGRPAKSDSVARSTAKSSITLPPTISWRRQSGEVFAARGRGVDARAITSTPVGLREEIADER